MARISYWKFDSRPNDSLILKIALLQIQVLETYSRPISYRLLFSRSAALAPYSESGSRDKKRTGSSTTSGPLTPHDRTRRFILSGSRDGK